MRRGEVDPAGREGDARHFALEVEAVQHLVQRLGVGVWGLGFGVWGLGFGV